MTVQLDRFIGLLAPHLCLGCGREGSVLCTECLVVAGEPPASRCAGCKRLTDDYKTCESCRSWLDVYSVHVATVYEGVYERLVHAYKFDVKRQAVESIAQIMSQSLPYIRDKSILLCPMPTAPARIRQRGFDHARLLALAGVLRG